MKKVFPYTIATLILLIALGILGGVKALQIRALIQAGKNMPPQEESVVTVEVRQDRWERTLHSIGSVRARSGVQLASDMPGVVEEILFEAGQRVEAGDILVRLDTAVERAELAAAQAKLDLARIQVRRALELRQGNVVAQAEADTAEATYRQAEAALEVVEATIQRKTIRAPFGGTVGIRQVDLGQYLAPGNPVVSLQDLQALEADFSLSQRHAAALSPGMEVRLLVNGGEPVRGVLAGINPDLDAATRALRLRASLGAATGALRPGMFGRVEVVLPGSDDVLAVPQTAVRYAPFGNSIFVVEADEEGVLFARQRFVRLGRLRGDFIEVVEGLEPGVRVVSDGVFKLRNNSRIVEGAAAAPQPEIDPRPEEA